jgi:hypothetical protein
VSGELMAWIGDGIFLCVDGQKEISFFRLRIVQNYRLGEWSSGRNRDARFS